MIVIQEDISCSNYFVNHLYCIFLSNFVFFNKCSVIIHVLMIYNERNVCIKCEEYHCLTWHTLYLLLLALDVNFEGISI